MTHAADRTGTKLNRRTTLGGLGAAVALGGRQGNPALAEAGGDLATHPLAGTWAVMTDAGLVPQTHHADGSFIAAFPPNYVDPATGLTFQGAGLGQWERTGERSGRFTFLQVLADPAGAYAGTFQLSASIEASEDGRAWFGTDSPRIVVRDPGNTVVFDQVVPLGPPVTATRISATPDAFVMPEVRPAPATPVS